MEKGNALNHGFQGCRGWEQLPFLSLNPSTLNYLQDFPHLVEQLQLGVWHDRLKPLPLSRRRSQRPFYLTTLRMFHKLMHVTIQNQELPRRHSGRV